MNRVLAITGGVGGAKLALGMQHVLPADSLTVVVNTGDDFEHLGLAISPDVDTVLYTLAGLANEQTGWGRADERWHFMAEIERLGGETWFRLGDKDLALHVERTRRLAAGESLESITERIASRLGVATQVVPMSNDRVRTVVTTDAGVLDFQDYFVRRRCEPTVRGVRYEGASVARPVGCVAQLRGEELQAVVICPSNPWLSIDPILAIPQWRSALQATRTPVVAVSPLIGGKAVKGPTAKIMRELELDVSPLTIEHHYSGVIDGLVLDHADAHLAARMEVPVRITRTLMHTMKDKRHLAREVLDFAQSLTSAAWQRSEGAISRR